MLVGLRVVLSGFSRTVADEKGVTAMEYGVIAAATIVAISVALLAIAPKMKTTFESISTALGS